MKDFTYQIIKLVVVLKLISLFSERQQKACQTERDTAVFYAGAMYDGHDRYNASDAANEYAKEVGGTTINLNFENQELDWPEDRETGRQLSKMYAENASGEVRVFLGENDAYKSLEMPDEESDLNDERHPLNTWETVEYPTLLANEEVTSITVYDPKTREETMVCNRGKGDGSTEDMVKQYNSYLESTNSEFRYGINENGTRHTLWIMIAVSYSLNSINNIHNMKEMSQWTQNKQTTWVVSAKC